MSLHNLMELITEKFFLFLLGKEHVLMVLTGTWNVQK